MDRPIDDAGVKIAPKRVSAEQVARIRPPQLFAADPFERIVAGEKPGSDRP
ncbi:hypothetical protein D3C71_2182420 [compost metagenome]